MSMAWVLQLSNSCLEWIKTWRNYNTFWEGIPLHNSQRKEGVFIGILVRVNLTKCHWMAVPGYPMSGLDIHGKGHGHEAIYNFVKETETGHISSLFKCLPAQLVQQWSDAGCSGIIIHGPPGCTSLTHFNLMGILLGVGSHIVEAYSSLGRTRVWYVISRILGDLVFTFLLIHPRDLLAFAATLFTWVVQLKLEMSTPKYLALVTASRSEPGH